MTSNDSTCLIDWNSPAIEFTCKPLIPLPNFDGHLVHINGDNPFDDLEMQINENEPFELILNKSLNSSFEQADQHNNVEIENNEQKSTENLIEVLDKINLDKSNVEMKDKPEKSPEPLIEMLNEINLNVQPSVSCKNTSAIEETTLNISSIEVSNDDDDIRTLKNRLCLLKSRYDDSGDTKLKFTTSVEHVSSKNATHSESVTVNESSTIDDIINKGFIAKGSLTYVKDIDRLMSNADSLDEDLSAIVPVWDEIGFISSSSDEEYEKTPTKTVSLENIIVMKKERNEEKVVRKTIVRQPLGVQDPNIRAKKTTMKQTRIEPLKAVIPIANMTKTSKSKLDQTPTLQSRLTKKLKADTTSLKSRRRSAPIATSTPTPRNSKVTANNSRMTEPKQIKKSTLPTRSCPPSPDSTTTSRISSKLSSSLTKGCSRKLALNVVSSSTNKYSISGRKTSKDVKSPVMKSTAPGVKSCVKNKENIVPFRY